MSRDHSIKVRQTGLNTGLDRSVPRLSTMRVHPDDGVREQLELPNLLTEQLRIAPLPAITGDHHDCTARQPTAAPPAQERADHLAQPSAAGPVRYQPPRCSQRLVGLPHSKGGADPGEPSANRENLDLIGHRTNDAMRQTQQRVRVRLHRTGNVDQHDDSPATYTGPPAAEPGQFAAGTQLGAQRTPQIDRAAMMWALSKRSPERRHHLQGVEKHGELRSILLGEGSHIAVAQHFSRARARRDEVISGY